MTTIPLSAANAQLNRLYEVAQEYRAKGYRDIVGPAQHELPEFLRGHEPDLIALSDTDNVVVVIKHRRSIIGTNTLSRLASAVENENGWRLELIVLPSAQPSSADIEAVRLLLARARARSEPSELALVVACAAIERAMFVAAARAGMDISAESVTARLKTLCAYGLLDDETYKTIDAAMKLRNDIIHGRPSDVDARPWVDTIAPIAEELIVV